MARIKEAFWLVSLLADVWAGWFGKRWTVFNVEDAKRKLQTDKWYLNVSLVWKGEGSLLPGLY